MAYLTHSTKSENIINKNEESIYMKLPNKIFKIILSLCIALGNLTSGVHGQDINAADSATVASELNALYNKTEGCSGDEPDYYCSGIILHADNFYFPEPWYLPNYR